MSHTFIIKMIILQTAKSKYSLVAGCTVHQELLCLNLQQLRVGVLYCFILIIKSLGLHLKSQTFNTENS